MQYITITGNLGRDAEYQETQGGDAVCRLNLGVKQGWGDRSQTNWYRVSVWGKRAKSIADNCFKGMLVTVIGELTIGEYNGKPQYDVRANDVAFQPRGDRRRDPEPQDAGWGNDDDALDDDVPF